jgi:hypothetical protein
MVSGSRNAARGLRPALRLLLIASQPSCSLVVPYSSMCRWQCIATQFAAEYEWAASSASMSSNGLSFLRVPGSRGSTGGLASGARRGDAFSEPVIAPPSICTVR